MAEWEYSSISLNDVPLKTAAIDVLNDAGEEGWELVVITPNNIAYLKRQMTKPRAKSSRQSSPPTK